MSSPRFSILIPTKGRSFLIPNAVRSGLQQTFDDFEVVLIDNDDGDATKKAVEGIKDPKFRYVRSGGRSMPDNWDFAFEQARGEYICLIEDKQALKRHALERLATEVDRHKPRSVRWMSDSFDDLRSTPRVWKGARGGGAHFKSSDEILDIFTTQPRRKYSAALPIPHLGCIHRSVLDEIKRGPMKRLCPPVSPDYTLAFLQLAYVDAVLHIEEALVVFVTKKHSNGQASILKLPQAKAFTKELGGKETVYYDRVPVKARTIPGSIYNDYVHMQSVVKGRLEAHPISWPMYFAECHRAIQLSVSLGIEMSEELGAWQQAFEKQPASIQEATRHEIGAPGAGPWIRRLFKATGNSLGFPELQYQVKAFVRSRITRDPAWQFPDAMAYIESEHQARSAGASKSSASQAAATRA